MDQFENVLPSDEGNLLARLESMPQPCPAKLMRCLIIILRSYYSLKLRSGRITRSRFLIIFLIEKESPRDVGDKRNKDACNWICWRVCRCVYRSASLWQRQLLPNSWKRCTRRCAIVVVQMISASSPISKNPWGGETKIDVSVGRVQRIQLGSPARRWRIKRFLCVCVCVSAGLFCFFF